MLLRIAKLLQAAQNLSTSGPGKKSAKTRHEMDSACLPFGNTVGDDKKREKESSSFQGSLEA